MYKKNVLEKGRLSSPYGRYSFLYDSNHLRRVVRGMMDKEGITVKGLAKDAGIYRPNLSAYLNKTGEKKISDFQIIKVCDLLGIKVELLISLK